jgi:hypothetical protein
MTSLLASHSRKLAAAGALAAFCLSLFVGAGSVVSAQDQDKEQIALSLARFLRAARTVVSESQSVINDPTRGDKGFTGEVVVAAAKHGYKLSTGVDPDGIDRASLHGRLLAAEMAAIREIIDEAQGRINRQGVGFKGFLPAIFAADVAERFSAKTAGMAEIKLTAPKSYVRNRKNLPDRWEHKVIETRFKSAGHPLGQHVADENGLKHGKPAFRLIMPEYYTLSCLSCHGGPKGKRDITGGKKEGGTLGELGGSISVVIYLK